MGAISIRDALKAFYLGERSTSKRHGDFVLLLRKISIKNIESKIKRILSVLSVKALVEYEARKSFVLYDSNFMTQGLSSLMKSKVWCQPERGG